jgi:VWFA-related protein
MILNKILILAIIISLTGLAATQPQDSRKPEVVFLSPEEGEMWVGIQKIRVRLKNIDPDVVRVVELYLDGSLVKELEAPPYNLTHTFDAAGQNRTLKAVVRGKGFKVLAQNEIRSFRVDAAHSVEVNEVIVPVVVKDRNGNYVRGLKNEDFQLFVDGKPARVSYIKPGGTTRFTMAQVLDISFSMRYKIKEVLRAAGDFMGKLMTKNDRATIVFFNHIVFDHLGFTSDIKELSERLKLQSLTSGETAVYDAVAYTLNFMSHSPGWNIIVIFSDGVDNSSYIDRYSLLEKVKKSAVVVYAIDNGLDKSEDLLKEICSVSGGETFRLDNVKETNKVFDMIREDIKAQYILYFNAGRHGPGRRFHTLTIKIKNQDYTVRTLKGYTR